MEAEEQREVMELSAKVAVLVLLVALVGLGETDGECPGGL